MTFTGALGILRLWILFKSQLAPCDSVLVGKEKAVMSLLGSSGIQGRLSMWPPWSLWVRRDASPLLPGARGAHSQWSC